MAAVSVLGYIFNCWILCTYSGGGWCHISVLYELAWSNHTTSLTLQTLLPRELDAFHALPTEEEATEREPF